MRSPLFNLITKTCRSAASTYQTANQRKFCVIVTSLVAPDPCSRSFAVIFRLVIHECNLPPPPLDFVLTYLTNPKKIRVQVSTSDDKS